MPVIAVAERLEVGDAGREGARGQDAGALRMIDTVIVLGRGSRR